jgi:hypothetical protein
MSVFDAPPKIWSSSSQKRRLNCMPILPAAAYGTLAMVALKSSGKSVSMSASSGSGSAATQ